MEEVPQWNLRACVYERDRSDVSVPRGALQFASECAPPSNGVMRQVSTLNQFDPLFESLIQEFNTPQSICGYLAAANACVLSKAMAAHVSLTQTKMLDLLCNKDVMLAEVRKAMAFIQKSRQAYVCEHASDFATDRDQSSYLRDWVANFGKEKSEGLLT